MLQGVSIDLLPGSKSALVGPSGGGKVDRTNFTSLIRNGFIPPLHGRQISVQAVWHAREKSSASVWQW